jgi:hypothetical protein
VAVRRAGISTWQVSSRLYSINLGQEKTPEGATMNRETALKIALVLVGFLFLALAYPLVLFVRQDPALSMMFSLYVTLGVFLLVAVRRPAVHRSLIAFTAWSSLAHAALMGFQAFRGMVAHQELVGVAVLVVIGFVFIALAPPKQLARSDPDNLASQPSQGQALSPHRPNA